MSSLKFAIALAGAAFLASPAIAQDADTQTPVEDPLTTGDPAAAPVATPAPVPVRAPAPAAQVQLEGIVKSVDALNGVFVMDTGTQDIRVELAGMDDYPLDAGRTPQVTVGNRVRVTARASTDDTGAMLQVMAVSLVVLPE